MPTQAAALGPTTNLGVSKRVVATSTVTPLARSSGRSSNTHAQEKEACTGKVWSRTIYQGHKAWPGCTTRRQQAWLYWSLGGVAGGARMHTHTHKCWHTYTHMCARVLLALGAPWYSMPEGCARPHVSPLRGCRVPDAGQRHPVRPLCGRCGACVCFFRSGFSNAAKPHRQAPSAKANKARLLCQVTGHRSQVTGHRLHHHTPTKKRGHSHSREPSPLHSFHRASQGTEQSGGSLMHVARAPSQPLPRPAGSCAHPFVTHGPAQTAAAP